MTTGKPAVVYGNMPNRGTISNLAPDAIAEAPPWRIAPACNLRASGELPPQLIGYMQPHVTQHELFIRAAMEGRRDHLYQAAMFDPLTASLLTLDQIVEMCDELIAAHGSVSQGGSLPELDTRRTLVPSSGKTFGPGDVSELRAAWRTRCIQSSEEYIKDWQLIGPFPAGNENRRGLDLMTPVEESFLRSPSGIMDCHASYSIDSTIFRWHKTRADDRGWVDLAQAFGPAEWAIAYAYAEVESMHAREAILRLGSDDGIKVWLNGQVVHCHETGRKYRPDSDSALAFLNAGVNRIFVKIDNYTAGWGFGLAVPKEHV